MDLLQDPNELLLPFQRAEKPRGDWRVGTEAEKFGVLLTETGGYQAPLPYDGPRSVQAVLSALVKEHDWAPSSEYDGGPIISLLRGGASITLEPAGQIELSGAPLETIHETSVEFRGHLAELEAVGRPMGIAWISLGFHPMARHEDLPWVPKLRYGIMKDYLPTRGSMALDMMRRTATVQANLDYDSEADAMRKLRLSLRIAPLVTTMFANSPFVEGQVSDDLARRGRVWMNMDPDRSGLLPFAFREDAGYQDYVDWALDAPMFMVKRGGKTVRNTGQTFRDFMARGYEDVRATHEDWETHLNTLFPEVRLKKTLEFRSADAQALGRTCALPALVKGLLYDATALDDLDALTKGLSYETLEASREGLITGGLSAPMGDRTALDWALDVVRIAEQGLERQGALGPDGRDETQYLAPLRADLERGQTPADQLRARAAECGVETAVLTVR